MHEVKLAAGVVDVTFDCPSCRLPNPASTCRVMQESKDGITWRAHRKAADQVWKPVPGEYVRPKRTGAPRTGGRVVNVDAAIEKLQIKLPFTCCDRAALDYDLGADKYFCPSCGYAWTTEFLGSIGMDVKILKNYIELLQRAKDELVEAVIPEYTAMPLVEGSVIGFRGWYLNDWVLTSTGVNGKHWQPGVNVAHCLYARHTPPGDDCGCGWNLLARFSTQSAFWADAPETILGAVEAWGGEQEDEDGGIIVHETGFRARYAKIILLGIEADWPAARTAAVKALAAEYGADTCKMENMAAVAGEHGQLMPEELLRWSTTAEVNRQAVVEAMGRHAPTLLQAWMENPDISANEIRRLMGFQ